MFFRMVLRRRKRYRHGVYRPESPFQLLQASRCRLRHERKVLSGCLRIVVVAFIVAVLGVCHPTDTRAAAIDQYLGASVAKVEFKSEDFIDVSALERAVAVRAGKPLDASDVRQSISTLYQTREFSQIEVDANPADTGLVITFKLRPNFFFADFRLRGDRVLRSPMSSLVNLPLGEVYSPKTVEQLRQKVQEALRDSGYYQAEVFPDVQFLSKGRLVTVNYMVNAGQRAIISGIEISGSPLLERSEVLQTMKLRPGAYFDNESLKRDFERLRKLYSDRGFLNAALRLEKLEYSPSSNAVLIQIQIDSGSFVYIELTGGKIPRSSYAAWFRSMRRAALTLTSSKKGAATSRTTCSAKGTSM
jgi:outer membrane protein assembly factor BamA